MRKGTSMIKVSIVIPVYNMERHLRQCLDSVTGQTLREIEIICVNDGSTDRSAEILREYADRDSRIVVIDKPNGGYGQTMNIGFDRAQGEYIGILESDDWAEPEMAADLFAIASGLHLDVIKAGFWYYRSQPSEENVPEIIGTRQTRNRVFCPAESFSSSFAQAEFFNIKPTIWSALYRRDFIRRNRVRFHETPGASYQDTSFNFQVWVCARRVMLTERCYVHYRQDSEASSVNSPGKVYCVCDEYAEMARFLRLRKERGEDTDRLEKILVRLKYDSYIWNYERLAEPLQKEFILRASRELACDLEEGRVDPHLYTQHKWQSLTAIVRVPEEYHRFRLAQAGGERYEIRWPEDRKPGISWAGTFSAGIMSLMDRGLRSTAERTLRKLRGR